MIDLSLHPTQLIKIHINIRHILFVHKLLMLKESKS